MELDIFIKFKKELSRQRTLLIIPLTRIFHSAFYGTFNAFWIITDDNVKC